MIGRFGLMTAAAAMYLAPMLAPTPARAQLWTWTKDQMQEYTKAWTGERFPDGRPKVPDALLERAAKISMEEVTFRNWGVPMAGGRGFGGRGFGGFSAGGGAGDYAQYEGGWQILHPGRRLVGRAITMMFMPVRPDLDAVVNERFKAAGNQGAVDVAYALDKLQPGDVLVVDLMGNLDAGAVVDDTLFYFIARATNNGGLVVDGALGGLDSISKMDMQAYFRGSHATGLTGVTLAGYNVPVHIGGVTVMPGDLVVGDREGVAFVPAQSVEEVLNSADTQHVHDEWTQKKFDEGKYKSSEIYSSPRDPALRQEYQEYLKKRLEEIRSGKK